MMIGIAFGVVLFAACLYAGWRGGPPERLTAAIFVLAAVSTAIVDALDPSAPGHTRFGVLAIDVITFAALLAIALYAHRIWTLWTTALQLLTVLAHVANILAPTQSAWAYAASIILSGFLMPPILGYGTWQHRKRLQTHGTDQAWSSFSCHS
jgi:hypothetical protein